MGHQEQSIFHTMKHIILPIASLLIMVSLVSCFHPEDEYLSILKAEAKKGNGEAQNELGTYYFEIQDFDEAIKWFGKSAQQDFAVGNYNMALCYINGWGTEKNLQKAIAHLTNAAGQGLGQAELMLGYIYIEDTLGCLDVQKSLQWFEHAAKSQIYQADFEIGILYWHGNYVERNDSLALHHFKQAAYHGNAQAQFMLGIAYRDGIGVSHDENLSVQWLKKAAEQGLMVAQQELSNNYFYGIGVEKDLERSKYWLDKAHEQRSLVNNADFLSKITKPEIATKKPVTIEPLPKDQIKTEADSLYQRGFQLVFGNNTPNPSNTEIYKEGIDCLTQATLKGNKNAKILLSYCYASGQGVMPSKATAASLFIGKGQIKYSIGKESYTIDFEIHEDGSYDKTMNLDML